jgi:hypothetical protein
MNNRISGPYQVEPETLDRHETLDAVDLGSWYILINGSMQFVDDEHEGAKLVSMLQKLN